MARDVSAAPNERVHNKLWLKCLSQALAGRCIEAVSAPSLFSQSAFGFIKQGD